MRGAFINANWTSAAEGGGVSSLKRNGDATARRIRAASSGGLASERSWARMLDQSRKASSKSERCACQASNFILYSDQHSAATRPLGSIELKEATRRVCICVSEGKQFSRLTSAGSN